MKINKYVVLGGLLLNLTACGLPVPIVVASYAADGISLVASGKTITDHALSAAVAEDCAMWRVARGDAICYPVESDTFEGPGGEALMAEAPGDETRWSGPTSWRADQPDAVRWGPRD